MLQPFLIRRYLPGIGRSFMHISREERKTRAVRFSLSLCTAILCIVLLGMMSCARTEEEPNVPLVSPCELESIQNFQIRCDTYDQPVCGCDGTTYHNPCEAQYYYGITSWTVGPCTERPDCFDATLVGDTSTCSSEYEPVCGCNGVTYPNACYATYSGVTSFSNGPCNSFQMTVCRDESFTVGVESRPDRVYVWRGDDRVPCATCSKNILSLQEEATFSLEIYTREDIERGMTKHPSTLYTFQIDVRNCID